jgi:formate dehydrogenase major subunit
MHLQIHFRAERRFLQNMKISRRKFLKISSGTIGTLVATETTSLGMGAKVKTNKEMNAPIKSGKQVPSICPYCAVGCAQIVTVDKTGKAIDVQGNPDSPVNQGTLCPKGAATYQLAINDLRWTKVKYRAPGSDHWEEKPLDWAMNRIADLVKATRDANFNEYEEIPDGKGNMVRKRVMNTYAIASLGGATMDNEWNYCHQKLMHALGVVYLENQARI